MCNQVTGETNPFSAKGCHPAFIRTTTNPKLRLHRNYSNRLSNVVQLAARLLTCLRRSFQLLESPFPSLPSRCRKWEKKKPVFSFFPPPHRWKAVTPVAATTPDIPSTICVVLITLLQEHAACSPCRISMDKNTDALLVCSPTLCTESSHNIVKYKRSLLTGSWLH